MIAKSKKETKFSGSPSKKRRKRWYLQSAMEINPVHIKRVKKWKKQLPSRAKVAWGSVARARKGNKLSRVFRVIFEASFIRTLIGSAVVVIFFSNLLIPDSVGGAYGVGGANWASQNARTDNSQTGVLAASQDTTQIETVKGIANPLPYFKVNQGFRFYHAGVDLDANTGDPVTPVSPGRIEQVIYSKYAYGNHVILDHGSGFKSLYAHLSKIEVKEGDAVNRGQVIAKAGSTGWSSGPHLHLELRINGEAVNPLLYLQQ